MVESFEELEIPLSRRLELDELDRFMDYLRRELNGEINYHMAVHMRAGDRYRKEDLPPVLRGFNVKGTIHKEMETYEFDCPSSLHWEGEVSIPFVRSFRFFTQPATDLDEQTDEWEEIFRKVKEAVPMYFERTKVKP
ncbi:hypothetical protein ACFLZN_02755 [Nanoarchaeota archaeon]